jgi:hypothetical protein
VWTHTHEKHSPEQKEGYPLAYRTEISPGKVELVLDSGTNEFMLLNAELVTSTEGRRTKIITAQGSVGNFSGTYSTPKVFQFPDGTELKLPRAVFAEGLSDNLASVGRLCEAGFSVLFEEGRYRIFRTGLVIKGECVHSQPRDPRTGLYPLTLTLQADCSSELPLSSIKGELGVAEVRLFLARFVAWAEHTYLSDKKCFYVDSVQRHISEETKEKLSHALPTAKLAKFYNTREPIELREMARQDGPYCSQKSVSM